MIALVLALTLLTSDQEAMNAARDLYASAAYEDALVILNRLPEGTSSAEEASAISQYRAFCLLALGRTTEAERAIEAVIAREPTYRPAANDVSPRVRSAFTDVRRRMLPAIIQQKYAQAKEAFDRKDFETAATAFGKVLDVMNDPDVTSAPSQLADLRTLAGGFRDLAMRAAAPPPPPVAPVPVAAPLPPSPPRIYSAADTDVVPPIIVRQELPAFPGQLPTPRFGALEITIDENGMVDFAVMRQTVSTAYDAMAVAATKTWRYKPATVNGVPVKFKKVIQVTVRPRA